MRRLAVAGTLIASVGVWAMPARADSIDGNWCNAAGTRQMQIEGTMIVTPGGRRLEGRYARHSFTYVASEGEAASPGATVVLQLVHENQIRSGGGDQPADVWHRCANTS